MNGEKADKLLDILKVTVDFLKRKGVEEPRLNAELMLCEVLNYDRLSLYINFDRPLTNREKEKYKELILRRINKEPLQYILGKVNFFGYNFIVNKNVLIPRPETENLIEKALSVINNDKLNSYDILEIGTGSGCISISLSKEMDKSNLNYKITAIDSFESAIELALKNSELNNIKKDKVIFQVKDIFDDDINFESYNIIISNPPYVSYQEYRCLPEEIRLFEPANALTDFEDGLKYYRRIFNLLSKNDRKCICLLEIGYNQKAELEKLLSLYRLQNYKFELDFNKIFRYLIIHK